jgi:hypothetical protein
VAGGSWLIAKKYRISRSKRFPVFLFTSNVKSITQFLAFIFTLLFDPTTVTRNITICNYTDLFFLNQMLNLHEFCFIYYQKLRG